MACKQNTESRTDPTTTSSQTGSRNLCRVKILEKDPIIRAPKSVPDILPTPPLNLAPPMHSLLNNIYFANIETNLTPCSIPRADYTNAAQNHAGGWSKNPHATDHSN